MVSIREPRETTNLAELYGQEPMPWSRALEALGYRLTVHTAFGVGLQEPHGASRWRF
jgi:hypothetical protein